MKKLNVLTRMLLLVALLVGSVSAWGADEVYKTALFGSSYNSKGVSSYTDTWYSTTSGFKVDIANFNNSNNGWDYIKCGRKNYASVATIITNAAIDEAVTKVAITIDAITAANINSIKLYTSSNKSTWTEVSSFTKATGAQEVSLSSPTANLYYKLEFDCASGSSNGLCTISKVEYYKAKAPTFTLTGTSNNESFGTVSVEDNVITGSPKTGYRYASPAYTVTEGEANVTSVVQEGDDFTVTATGDCTVQINFEAIPSHDVTWNVNGATTVESYKEGEDVKFPSNPNTIAGKVFKGWSSEAIDGTTDTAPTFVTKATMSTTDLNYYAVFATSVPGITTITDVLTNATTGVGTDTNYDTWSDKTVTSDAVYAGNSAGNYTTIQLRSSNNNSGIITTTSGGKAKKVTVDWNNNTADERTLDIYGNNTAYTAVTDLYDIDKRGTKLGSIVKGTSTELTITGDYTYIGFRSNSGAMYLNSITIDWETDGYIYASYCTTIPATVPVTISDAKYATFASDYDLDFSGVDGLYAYTATVADNKITFNRVTKAKVGEGLLLYADVAENTPFNIPITSSNPEAVSGNKLVRGTGAAVANTNDEGVTYNYVLSNNGGEVNFYRAAGKVVATSKAYLKNIPAGVAGAKFFLPTGEEETDGIRSIENSELRIENSNYYNLSGQRVGKDYKGIVIVNGKKIVRK